MRIAILGATSHIAKNLISFFLKDSGYKLYLFSRRNEIVHEFLAPFHITVTPIVLQYDAFGSIEYDVIINCVGIADPRKQKADPYESFLVTERFDDLAIDYIKEHKCCKYINFSSGAVFGTEFQEPVGENSTAVFLPNALSTADSYRIAKLNAEAKHRCLFGLPIVDVRVFSFFSRYIDLDAGFMLSEVARCLHDHCPFKTNASDMVRDYISPRDLYSLIFRIILAKPINTVVDVGSARPTRKSEILELLARYFGLVVELVDGDMHTVSGIKSEYFSTSRKAAQVFGFESMDASLSSIESEMSALINIAGWHSNKYNTTTIV